MAIFQNSVVTKYLARQNKSLIADKWIAFSNHFHNNIVQDNIRNSKEEQYQEGFLRDLFVTILGYTLNPAADFNLTTEYKNVKDAKKADGAIIIHGKVLAVIELKGTNTTDLSKIESQAFGYKNNQSDCKYIITSNFEKIRFYIDNAIEHIEFNLFTLNAADFELLYLLLAFENLSKGIAKNIKDESLSQEDTITKKLYKDYSLFKRELYQDLVLQNPTFEPLELFKKSQKLLDRFLFLFFAEDRQLLPPNSVRLILNDWRDLQDRDVEVPLYERFKKYFEYLNTGYKGKRYDVFAYNGGLFKPDAVLDHLLIDDELLFKHTLKLADYDFDSEVDVNILGHIFENSLNELDEIKAQIEGQIVDKTKTKRKKDGVFYTPKYITKYIVDNTVGKLCEEKKLELQLSEEEYSFDKKRPKKTIQALAEKLEIYRSWLLQLTICDPACGSGAFLNQALDFLITEHKYVDELQAKLFGDAMVLSDVEKSILENNLFGIDLNEESVEIAKLSLWLRTAQPNRKLNDLNNNIKCGNSLIDDVAIAGSKAFKWQTAFPQVFKEKNKKAFHLVFTTHNSRTSQRMIDYHVKKGPAIELELEEEIALTKIFKEIILEYDYKCVAYNICKDHVHLILVCEEDELTAKVQKLKSISSKLFNRFAIPTGRDPVLNTPMGHDPLNKAHEPFRNNPMGHDPLKTTLNHDPISSTPMGHSPLKTRITPMGLDPLKKVHIPLKKAHDPSKHNNHLWSQKFFFAQLDEFIYADISTKPAYIATDSYLDYARAYIRTNRDKHNLPDSKELKSIIKDFTIDLDVAFATEYKGGFDVVIGNPPYGVNFNEVEKKYLQDFDSLVPDFEIYIYFISLYKKILKKDALLSYIFPNTFLSTIFGKKYRETIFSNLNVYQIIDLSNDNTFTDAAVRTCIFSFINNKEDYQTKLLNVVEKSFVKMNVFDKNIMMRESGNILSLFAQNLDEKVFIEKLQKHPSLKDFYEVSQGLIPYDKYRGHDEDTIKNRIWHSDFQKDTTFKKELKGGDISRYNVQWNGKLWVSYGDWLAAPRKAKFFTAERILIREIISGTMFCGYSADEYYNTPSAINIINESKILDLKYSLSILNSRLLGWFVKKTSPKANKGLFPKILVNDIKNIPLVKISEPLQQPFIQKADAMLSLNKNLQEVSQKFQRSILRKFDLQELPKKLQDWYKLSYAEFIKELTKKKVKLSLSDEAEWEDYFNQESQKALAIKTEIDTADKAIDKMVYELYGLTKEEIDIVENG